MNSVRSLDLRGTHFLVIDDSWKVGKELKAILEGLGADVAGPVATASEAQDLVAARTHHIALVDINFRDMELAYDLIDHLHERGIRVIIITGYAALPQRLQSVAAIIQKPFTETDLLAVLSRVKGVN